MGHLLMNIPPLYVVILAAEVHCLEYLHIWAHRLVSFMNSYATDLASTIHFLHGHPLSHSRVAIVAMAGRHADI